ncbi:DUF1801 domain-containing protein [Phenylobacterium sp.]|uniref:DUF1801 domain-containing protein n=1 Tax=Phenylobacterium sp. TaxID=1871053 RepID=UPI002737B3AD|nr:DUF1801 domain-containing protein [Phenylobacterium sp.]MDP3870867.1 DUF1801 domain-containing protein [Phenylobacterium sp.]
MAEAKTRPTGASVEAFLRSVPDERRRQECYGLVGLMQNLVGEPARMWGESTVGFGSRNAGSEGATFRLGFSPRKSEMSIHLGCSFEGFEPTLARLGKHRLGKGCVYVKSFDDINIGVLRQLLLDANVRVKAG